MPTNPGAPLGDRLLFEADHEHRLNKEEQRKWQTAAFATGRILLAALFLVCGLEKLFHYDATLAAMLNSGKNESAWVLPIAIAIEIFGGAALALGYKVRITALSLTTYLGMLTILLYWDLSQVANREAAMMNLALIGGLLAFVGHGSGSLSLDHWLARHARRHLEVVSAKH
jgi:putative oxidoreductase